MNPTTQSNQNQGAGREQDHPSAVLDAVRLGLEQTAQYRAWAEEEDKRTWAKF